MATTTIQAVADQVAVYMRAAYVTNTGAAGTLRAMMDNPEDSGKIFPYGVVYADSGDIQTGPVGAATALTQELHNLAIEIHWARRELKRENEMLGPFITGVPRLLIGKLLYDSKWGGLIHTFQRVTYKTGPLGEWGGLLHFGVRFIVAGIKLQGDISA